MTPLLSRNAAAQMLDIMPNTLATWACTKRYDLPFIKIGRSVKYQLSDLEAFIANNKKAEPCH
jgi:hypothetical protein